MRQLALWTIPMTVAVGVIATEILEGVGNVKQVHYQQGKIALHTRRQATAEETAAFIKRKEAGDYEHRTVEKGIV